jgi:hypothetical protein
MPLSELQLFADKVGVGYRGLKEEELRRKLQFEAAQA